jgi:hypothetical protein
MQGVYDKKYGPFGVPLQCPHGALKQLVGEGDVDNASVIGRIFIHPIQITRTFA